MSALSTLFSVGFRPFFLCAGGYGALAAAAWTGWLGDIWGWPEVYPSTYLHAHEMLFGFALAAVAGFLNTAVPQWTSRPPLRGLGLAALAGSWLLGRLGILGAGVIGPVWAMAADLIFPIALCAVIANMLIRAGNRRNYGFIALLGGAALANLCWHLELADLVTWEGDISGAEVAQQLMLNLLLLIVAIVGGRVIPMFSANWLRRQGQTLAMRHPVWLQRLCITGLVLVTVAELLGPIIDDRLLGALALATGLAYWFRLSGWNGHKTWAHPLVWILHLAYFWVGLALLLKGGQYLIDIPAVAARHAAAMGAVGSMIMAIMPRVSLGHTGRELILPRPMLVAYALILAAPILRVASPFVEADWYQVVLLGSGMCWTAAFGIFIWCFAPMLFKPRAT